MKINILHVIMISAFMCVYHNALLSMNSSPTPNCPYSLTNTGKIAFTALILGCMKRELIPNQIWRILDNPTSSTISIEAGTQLFTFQPTQAHTKVKIIRSPDDGSLSAIVDEAYSPVGIEIYPRPQTAPAHSRRR